MDGGKSYHTENTIFAQKAENHPGGDHEAATILFRFPPGNRRSSNGKKNHHSPGSITAHDYLLCLMSNVKRLALFFILGVT